jgi:hypothetical protein
VHIAGFILHKARRHCNKIGILAGKSAPHILTSFPAPSLPTQGDGYVSRRTTQPQSSFCSGGANKKAAPLELPAVAYDLFTEAIGIFAVTAALLSRKER